MLASLLSLQAPKLLNIGACHILAVLLLFAALALLCHAIYNRYFHPLHSFPGPFWGSVTDLYKAYLFGTRKVHLEQLKLHQQYGQCRSSYERAATKHSLYLF